MEEELQHALNELCNDLFAAATPEDANTVLMSLTSLADVFPQAQKVLGRLLSRHEDHRVLSRCGFATKLSTLSRFLYQKNTARSAVSLLAALANNNERNQRRIVQNVVGTQIILDTGRWGTPACNNAVTSLVLYVLTIPDAITSTYRRWRKRVRELRGCRIPSGVPPSFNGVPMPCDCDECLGAEQLLSTWQNHFQDLSRWKQNIQSEQQLRKDSSCESTSPTALSPEKFLCALLADYEMAACSVEGKGSEQKKADAMLTNSSEACSSLVYYFISPEEIAAAKTKALPPFNPLCHVSAIALAGEIDMECERSSHPCVEPDDSHHKWVLKKVETSSDEDRPLERVVLFTSKADIESCIPLPAETSAIREASSLPSAQIESTYARLSVFFTNLVNQHGEVVRCGDLTGQMEGDDDENASTAEAKQLLTTIIGYCHDDDVVPLAAFQRMVCQSCGEVQQKLEYLSVPTPRESTQSTSHHWRSIVTMTANLREKVLEIDCLLDATVTRGKFHHWFSAVVPQHKLIATDTEINSGLELLQLSDETLAMLLSRCRICSCADLHVHSEGNMIHFRPKNQCDHISTLEVQSEFDPPKQIKATPACKAIVLPLSGLSTQAKQTLMQLESKIPAMELSASSKENVAVILDKLAKVISNCNERVSFLSLSNVKAQIGTAPEAHRVAAIARCRHCRDILIRLSKKLKLHVKSSQSSISSRVQKIINACLMHSERFDPWETPDARVKKLNLNQRLWANGFPDAAFYQESSVRQRANRRRQQQLSRQLLAQQHGQVEPRTKVEMKVREK